MFIIVGLITFLITFFVVNKFFKKQNIKFPPGPTGWPFVGNALQLGAYPFLKHEEYRKVFGDVHTVSMFGHKIGTYA